ncbi:MAG: hypothetical protein J3Q66DRAFT_400935 [Benniella sp.]|nr:MAG: hypothetical protein J3Q66DRAFT_400935 [Benniella sp.]
MILIHRSDTIEAHIVKTPWRGARWHAAVAQAAKSADACNNNCCAEMSLLDQQKAALEVDGTRSTILHILAVVSPQRRSASHDLICLERLHYHLALQPTTTFRTFRSLVDHLHGTMKATQQRLPQFCGYLDTTAATTAKRARLSLISHVVSLMDPTGLCFVSSIFSGVIVATKDLNEKRRDVAYDPLVSMGHKMKAGAGLAGTTPHMVSAVITSLSRLLFQFYKDLDPAMVSEAISTMRLFVNSSNHETVKSALGFIKVTTISLDVEIVLPHLQGIVSGIIRWSHEHKGHFKVKVRHILERLVRRFGHDDIVAFVPEADKKLLVNIKKCRERAKRKKANASEMEMDGEADEEGEETTKKSNKPHATLGSAYEDALYGSESDLSDDDDDQKEDDTTGKTTQKKSNKKKQGADAWMKEDGDTPLDSLDRTAVSRVTASHPSTQVAPKVKDLSSTFKTSDGEAAITMPLDARSD